MANLRGAAKQGETEVRVSKDDAELLKRYRHTAERGSAFAQYALGFMYAEGRGMPQDDAEAVKWYRLAKRFQALARRAGRM
jgi:TPR repeat protein